ncbi:MAG TPA: hypothetical protein VFI06_07095 [Chitinophagaceae bacterium]|nr:hypothetical protein [Chitinophagaceae bacterium]
MKGKWLLIAMLFPALSFSQENSAKPRFNTIASGGIIMGQSDAKPLYQLSSGLSFDDRWFTGVGVGLDYYNLTSIPLFADFRMNFGKKRFAFVYTNTGYSFPVNNSTEIEFLKISDKYKGGFYMDAGLGYRLRINHSNHVSVSAGYSRKDITEERVFQSPCGIVGPCYPTTHTYEYHYSFGRIVAKLSWDLMW